MIEQYMRQYQWAQSKLTPVYMLVTKDRFELPLAVADSVTELARMVGVHQATISKSINTRRKSRYVRVYVDLEEDE